MRTPTHAPTRRTNSHAAPPLRALLPALLLALLLPSLALAERRERLVEGWRPVHYDVRLTFDRQLSKLERAETRITVRALRNDLAVVDLDFGELDVDGVTVGGARARYEHGGGRLNVSLPRRARAGEQFVVSVAYHGRPKDGLILTNDRDGIPSATGDNWPDRVHHWIPSLDHPSAKATVEFTVTSPADMHAVAIGRPVGGGANRDRMTTRSWRQPTPVPPYCMIVAVGKFALIAPATPLARRLPPLAYYVPQSQRALGERGFSAAPPSLDYFGRLVAPYPYETLAHIVGATRFGGMENSTAIVYATDVLDARPNDPLSPRFGVARGIVELIAHETAHQWFGDAVTPATWADLWLSEGFATYFAGLFVERYEGEAAFRDYMRRKGEQYLAYSKTRRAPIRDRDTENLNGLLNPNTYQKGAWVLHMLRRQLGDEAFFRGVRAYYRAHLHSTATTEDLRAALERASGRDLRAFFAQWVEGGGHPHYRLSVLPNPRAARRDRRVALTLRLEQLQKEDAFTTPVPVEIVTAGGQVRRHTLRPTGRVHEESLLLQGSPREVRIDPGAAVLKEAELAPAAKAASARATRRGPSPRAAVPSP